MRALRRRDRDEAKLLGLVTCLKSSVIRSKIKIIRVKFEGKMKLVAAGYLAPAVVFF